ncbi:MAG: sugar phosphate isomerase/epimerase family protein [Akkermansiaceae bacterium]
MKLTGFADEAAPDLATQIKATRELGWDYISARGIDGKNIHDLSDTEFDHACGQLEDAGIRIAEFGSLIGSWSKSIDSDFDLTLGEVERCIPRMQRLGTQIVRIMSYAQEPWGEDQHEQERFRRLREITKRFSDAGLTAAHENCMNWGGFSAAHTLRLVEEVPGLKLIFDTGNPVFQIDRSIDPAAEGSQGKPPPNWQDAWQFYQTVREHIIHIHIKDCRNPRQDGEEPEYVFPGEGQAYIPAIIDDLKNRDYSGFVAIEPHVATVFHAKADDVDWEQCYNSYIEYGRQLESLINHS